MILSDQVRSDLTAGVLLYIHLRPPLGKKKMLLFFSSFSFSGCFVRPCEEGNERLQSIGPLSGLITPAMQVFLSFSLSPCLSLALPRLVLLSVFLSSLVAVKGVGLSWGCLF